MLDARRSFGIPAFRAIARAPRALAVLAIIAGSSVGASASGAVATRGMVVEDTVVLDRDLRCPGPALIIRNPRTLVQLFALNGFERGDGVDPPRLWPLLNVPASPAPGVAGCGVMHDTLNARATTTITCPQDPGLRAVRNSVVAYRLLNGFAPGCCSPARAVPESSGRPAAAAEAPSRARTPTRCSPRSSKSRAA
jgi:hypothetical protein